MYILIWRQNYEFYSESQDLTIKIKLLGLVSKPFAHKSPWKAAQKCTKYAIRCFSPSQADNGLTAFGSSRTVRYHNYGLVVYVIQNVVDNFLFGLRIEG
jgi:hypothetical protein